MCLNKPNKIEIIHFKRPNIIKINVFTLFLRKIIRNKIKYLTNKCNKHILSQKLEHCTTFESTKTFKYFNI